MPGNIGPLEIVIVLIIALVVFGPKRLPELGRSLGRGIREFRGSLSGQTEEEEKRSPGELGAGSEAKGAGEEGPVVHKRT